MNVTIATEARFRKNANGVVCSDTGGREYLFWRRYLEVFGSVTVVGRMSLKEGPAVAPVEGDGVSFFPLPDYVGPKQYLLNYRHVKQRIRRLCTDNAAFIARVPGVIGTLMVNELQNRSWPYGLEVVGDPYDSFAPGTMKHPIRPLSRLWFCRKLRSQVVEASSVAYVTEHALQRRYPPASGAFTTYYSSIRLQEQDFNFKPREFEQEKQQYTLITVGMLGHLHKATDVLIDAIATCVSNGFDLKLRVVGDGIYRRELESRAIALGLEERVQFCGLVPAGEAVRALLDRSDLFVLPSRTEGLPRALIEAMARGLPCIGSTVGGFPELLPPDDLVPPSDASALAKKIQEIISSPERMTQMSKRNWHKAKEYQIDVLRSRWNQFYQYLKDITAQEVGV